MKAEDVIELERLQCAARHALVNLAELSIWFRSKECIETSAQLGIAIKLLEQARDLLWVRAESAGLGDDSARTVGPETAPGADEPTPQSAVDPCNLLRSVQSELLAFAGRWSHSTSPTNGAVEDSLREVANAINAAIVRARTS